MNSSESNCLIWFRWGCRGASYAFRSVQLLFIFMPNIGRFFIDQVEGVRRADGSLLQVTRISCACLECGRQLRLVPGHGLLDLDGAAVLTCPLCDNR